jgi:hypothetical protein
MATLLLPSGARNRAPLGGDWQPLTSHDHISFGPVLPEQAAPRAWSSRLTSPAARGTDLFVVPTISFHQLYGLLIVGQGRRQILWFTAHPTAEWIANQVTEACGWEQAPRYLIRDRDGAYGEVFIRRLRSIGIRDRPRSPRCPWQNGYAERPIGSIRRECLDRVIVFSGRHLRHLLLCYMKYYNGAARIYPWRKMRRSGAPSIAPGTFFFAEPWADCITNMPGFTLR